MRILSIKCSRSDRSTTLMILCHHFIVMRGHMLTRWKGEQGKRGNTVDYLYAVGATLKGKAPIL